MQVIDFKDAKCRHCYKCVRHCAVKAICVRDEQARIMVDHCINCGRCLEVCPQNAKTFASDMERVKRVSETGVPDNYLHCPVLRGSAGLTTGRGRSWTRCRRLGFSEVRERRRRARPW